MVVGWIVAAAPALGADRRAPRLKFDGELPLAPELEGRVRFWIDVFTRYSLDEAIVHDREHPEIVLAVVPLRSSRPEELDAVAERYRALIDRLGEAAAWERGDLLLQFRAPLDPRWIRAARDRIRVQPGQREVFARGLLRSRRYLEPVRRTLRAAGVPEMLAYLPHVESSFDPDARSRAGAVGLWQLMPETARRYLRVDARVDERRQPIRSTRAAAAYLRASYEALGSWPLAITAYNYGLNGMRRAVAATGSTDLARIIREHRSPSFGFACRNFYAEFLAAAHVAAHEQAYFPELRRWRVHVVKKGDTLWHIARRYGTTVRALRSANREALAGSRFLRLGQRLMIRG